MINNKLFFDDIKSKKFSVTELHNKYNYKTDTIQKHAKKLGIILPIKKYKKYQVNKNFFSKWSSEMAYILGFIMADGCLCGKTKKNPKRLLYLSIGLSFKDIDLLYNIKNAMEATNPIKKSIKNGHRSITFNIFEQTIVNDLLKLGITPKKSKTLKWIENCPDQFKHDLVRGYFDGDGSICSIVPPKCKKLTLKTHFTGTKNVLQGIYNSFGIERNIYRNGSVFAIRYGKYDSIKLCNWMYQNRNCLKLERKYKIFTEYMNNSL